MEENHLNHHHPAEGNTHSAGHVSTTPVAAGHHDHASHDHSHKHGGDTTLLWPLLLTAVFAVVEVVGGLYTGSLALLGDAGHMLSDVAALGLAWLGAWIARRPASSRHSYGLMRAEVIVALVNGLVMLVVVAAIVYEAILRLQNPQPVHGAAVTFIALVGLAVNIIVARQLHQHQHNINNRAALLHVIGDMLGSIAAVISGIVIYFSGWMPIDPILSLVISALILFSTVQLLREVLQVLMEGVPRHLDIDAVTASMSALPDVHSIHSVHIWALSSEITAISAHVTLNEMDDWQRVLVALRAMLHERYGIDHVTLQPELQGCAEAGATACWLTSHPH
ncbi:MAG: cation diffusion facilitator family transporter [Pseudomonadota bacterium]